MPKAELQIKLCAADQYGLRTLILYWHGQAHPELRGEQTLAITAKSFCQTATLDMAADVLAGQPVELWAIAINTMGFSQQSALRTLNLPQLEFHNSLAATLAAARQDYALHQNPEKLLQNLSALRRLPLPVGLFLAVGNVEAQIALRDDSVRPAILANLWQIILRIEEGKNADIAANWRAARDDLQQAMPDWHIPENALLTLLNRTLQAWQDNLHAQNLSESDAQTQRWQQIAAWIRSGQRAKAIAALASLEHFLHPALKFERLETDDQDTAALQEIRANLDDPNITPQQRAYLYRLIEPDSN